MSEDPADAAREIRLRSVENLGELEPKAFSAAFRALAEDPELSGRQRRTVASARLVMRRTRVAAERLDQISVQAGPGIFPNDLSDHTAHLVRDEIAPLRRRLLDCTGIRIPGVGVGPDPALAQTHYWLLIHGVPYHEGMMPANARLLVGDDRDLVGHRVRNAWSGETALWTMEAGDEGLALHDGIVWLLEGVLRTNLAHFVTLPEVEHQIDAWEAGGGTERRQLLATAVPSRRSETRLVALIGRLAREQVAVNHIGTIIETFGDLGPNESIGALTAAARVRLVDMLPGARGDREFVDVPEEVVEVLRAARGPLQRNAASLVAQTLRHTIGNRAPGQFALVVDEPWRAPVQTVCERILASAAVLSSAERRSFDAPTMTA